MLHRTRRTCLFDLNRGVDKTMPVRQRMHRLLYRANVGCGNRVTDDQVRGQHMPFAIE
jgi:hypothetical protein